MIDLASFLLFVGASAVALAIPGPTVALVITRSLTDGRRVSVPLALGIGAGTLVGSALALAGAGAVLLASATAFTILKLIGAAYLVYLGIKLLRSEPTPPDTTATLEKGSTLRGLRDGFLVTMLNPKSIAFSVAFIPQFIAPNGNYAVQAAVLTITFTALATLNGLVFALGTDVLRRFVRRVEVLRWVNKTGGGLMIASGVTGLFLKRPAI
ncbi:MAG: LysE family translocator [Litorimonas sp.]